MRAISELCRCGEIDEVKNQEEWYWYEPVFYSRLTSMDFTEKYAMYLFTKIISFEAKLTRVPPLEKLDINIVDLRVQDTLKTICPRITYFYKVR